MAKYLFEARYTTAGAQGLSREGGSGRRDVIANMARELGGKLESFNFTFGEIDAYVIVDLPDDITAAAVALTVNQRAGASVKTVKLIAPEEMDQAVKKSVNYSAPGQRSYVP